MEADHQTSDDKNGQKEIRKKSDALNPCNAKGYLRLILHNDDSHCMAVNGLCDGFSLRMALNKLEGEMDTSF